MISLLPILGKTGEVSSAGPLPVVTVVGSQAQTSSDQPEVQAQPTAEVLPIVEPTATFELAGEPIQPQTVDPATLAVDGLAEFVAQVHNNQPGTIAGIFVPGLFALPVTGQPAGDGNYVSPEENVLTQYQDPAQSGVVAILAHNYLNSGRSFFDLKPDQEVYLVYGDGRTARFRVTTVEFFQALEPTNVRSDFRDLNGPGGAILSYDQLYNRMYTTPNQLVFQTCLEANGDLSWGRLFVKAEQGG